MKTRCIQVKDTHDETYTVFQMKPVKRQITKQHCYLVDEVRTKPIETTQCQIYDVPELTTYPPKECKTCEGKGKGEVEGSKGATDHGCRKVVANSTVKSEVSYCVKVPKYKTEVCAEIETYELVPVERTRTVSVCVPRIEVYPCEITVKKWFPQTIKCCSTCAVNHPKKQDSRAESSWPLYPLSRSFSSPRSTAASQRSRAEPSVSLLRTRQLCHSHVIDRHISGA